MDTNQKTRYETPKMGVVVLRNHGNILFCASTDPSCINLGYNEDVRDFSDSV